MADDIECHIRLTHDDFIMANHRVHEVSVLPGVTFLDVVYRVLEAQGVDVRTVALRNILFAEPVVTREGFERDLRVTIGAGDPRPVRVDSRWSRHGAPVAPWRENMRAELIMTDDPEPAVLDVDQLKADAVGEDDMDVLYGRTRREGIRHGPAMTCGGRLHKGESYLLAELSADPGGRAYDADFYLHPAKMDASTLVAFGQDDQVGAEPFIPFHVGYFRAWGRLAGTIHVFVAHPEVPSPTGDLLRNDYTLHDGAGNLLAEVRAMACKRIRRPDLITRLLAEVDPAPAAAAPGPLAAVTRHLRGMVGTALGCEPADVATDAGFYDLGLDSVALLRLGEELEPLVGTTLYPTLLFEYGDIDSLARHLVDTYPVQVPDPAPAATATSVTEPSLAGPDGAAPTATGPDGPAGAAMATCHVAVWMDTPDPHPAPDLHDLVAFDVSADLVAAWRTRGHRVTTVNTLPGHEAGGADVTLDPTDRNQVDRLLGTLATQGHDSGGYVITSRPGTEGVNALWALGAALVDRRPTRRTPIVLLAPAAPDGRTAAPLAAYAATVCAEVPLLDIRLVEIDTPTADLVLGELDDESGEHQVRYQADRRQVRRWNRARPGPVGSTPFRTGGGYLVAGGTGGIGRLLAEHLTGRYGARVVLLARSVDDGWVYPDNVQAVPVDLADPDATNRAVDRARELLGRIDGVLHCAGTVRDGLFFRQRPADLAAVCTAKVAGTDHLDAATAGDDLDFFALFASLSAVLPNPGQADYAYANAYQWEFARWRADRADRPGRTLAIAWPLWADGGMRASAPALARSRAVTGMVPMPTDVALDLLTRGLAGPHNRFAVVYGDPESAARLLPAPEKAPAPVAADPAVTAGPALVTDPAVAGEPVATARAMAAGPPPIAVIGVAGRYPGAAGLDEFWRNLAEGRDSIVEVPHERWDHDRYFDADKSAEGRTYGRWGGFIEGVDRFDPAFFGISRRDAERMDPQERLFLTTSWRVFEDAGYPPRALAGERVGVFVGVMWNHYQLFAEHDGGVAPVAMHASIANRVSSCLDLHGPSMAVDTACSSSLTAVHLAMQSLRWGESTLALAGGVNVTIHPQKYLQLARGQFLSDDGRCRSFGADATGYVPGEGTGAVLLKPLDRALADGDRIYGILRASALNHAGRTSGYTVPSPAAQGGLVRAAIEQAGWDPATIGYVEAHGTGTSLGDPIEIEGLRQAFAGADLPEAGCAIGSVKSNIGHLESAAGIAGLTKVLLQLRHGELVPSLHSARINPHIALAGTPFRVQQTRTPWPRPAAGLPRRAGVSAFGAGGANAHVLVEEAIDDRERTPDPGPAWLFVLSARTGTALRAYAERCAAFLTDLPAEHGPDADRIAARAAWMLGIPDDAVDPAEPLGDLGFDATGLRELGDWLGIDAPSPDATVAALAAAPATDPHLLADLAYTSQVGRTPMAVRLAVVATDLDGLRGALRRYVEGAPAGAGGFWAPTPDAVVGEPDTAGSGHAVADFRAGRLAEVAAHWVAGGEVDWAACHTGNRHVRRRSLPGCPLQEEVCWVGRWRAANRATGSAPEPAAAPGVAGPAPRPMRVPGEVGGSADGAEVGFTVLDAGIALVTMHGAGGGNMFTPGMMRGLTDTFATIAADDTVKVVVVTGTEKVFSMGATPDALETLAGGGSRFTDAPFVYEGMLRCDRPVIAALSGHASGGGLAFGLYADMVVMAREAVYSANFMAYGFTPGMGATYVLEHRFGPALATEMLFTGRPFAGEELERRGANVVFTPRRDVLATALTMARSVAEKPGYALRVLKADLAARTLHQLAPVIAREAGMHERVFDAGSVARVRERVAKVNQFRAGGTVPVRPVTAVAPVPTGPDPAAPAGPEAVSAGPGDATAPAEPGVDEDRVADVIYETLSASLYLDRAEIDPNLSFSEQGLDSIGAVELVRELNRAFGLDIDSVAVYDQPTVTRLVRFVGDLVRRDRGLHDQAVRAAHGEPHPAPAGGRPGGAASAPIVLTEPETSAVTEPGPTPAPVAVTLDPVVAEPSPGAPAPAGADRGGDAPIAVVGMAGTFPDARDLDEYWSNLAAGRNSVREVPPDRWDIDTYYDPDRRAPGRTYSKWAALLDDIDSFDPRFFRMSPLEAAAMDPQQRLFLQTAWAGLEDAGYAVRDGDKRRWGVFVGCAAGDYLDLLRRDGRSESAHAFLGNSGSVLAARIAYLLDFTGPTMAIDTACSSSLVAVHLACESIRTGECEAAVAGGVALMVTPRMHILTSKAGMLSPTGRCAPFDASADGIVLGEGCGVVVLKRLDRALADGDHVHGVLLGSGVNGDGRTNGLTAPSAASQAELIARVQRRAGVVPADVTYVEAHGTGTALGDPIEVKALGQVLRAGGTGGDLCGIGSVKGNIGHTTLAAGIAGLLKVLLALRHRTVPPSVNFTSANPEIDFERNRLRPVTALEPWPAGRSGRLVGAVSSFGFSGTNAHVVVAGPPPSPARRPDPGHSWVVPVSAPDPAALHRVRERLADRLSGPDAPALADVAYTLAVGREHFPVRAAFVVGDLAELVRRLRSPDMPVPADPRAEAYLAGGQVDWLAGYRNSGARRVSLPTYPFAVERHWVAGGPAEPEHPAPRPPRALAVRPEDWIVADHTVGGTPTLPGVVCLELAVCAVRDAGLAGPVQISGVTWLRPVEVTAPGTVHLRLIPDDDGWRFELSAAGDDAPVCARGRISPATGRPDAVDLAAVRARCASVRGGEEIYAGFTAAGIGYGLAFRSLDEVWYGADEALARLTLPPARAAELAARPVHPSMLDGALQAIAALAGSGSGAGPALPFALASCDVFGSVPATGYAHAVRDGSSSYRVTLTDAAGEVRVRFTGLALRRLAGTRGAPATGPSIYVPRWREIPAADPRPRDRQRILVVAAPDATGLADALVVEHRTAGDEVTVLPWFAPPAGVPDGVYFLAGGRVADRAPERDQAPAALLAMVQALLDAGPVRRPPTLKVVLGGAVPVGADRIRPAGAGLPGLVGSIAAEYPTWTVGCVDVGTAPTEPARLARLLHAEPADRRVVAYRDGVRLGRVLEPAAVPRTAAVPYRRHGTYVVLGGAGGIGQVLCRHLARTVQARLVILGRRPQDAAIAELVTDIERFGGRARYLRADATDPAALRRALRQARREFGALHGAFHAALVLRDRTVARLGEADLAAVLAPKVAGAVAFGEALATERLDFLTFFSSAVSFTDSAGQAGYAAASTFEDAYALSLRARCRFPVSVVNWGYWGGVGVVADERYARRMASFGVQPITPAEGMAALAAVLGAGLPQTLVVTASASGLTRLGVAETAVRQAVQPAESVVRAREAFAELERLVPVLVRWRLPDAGTLAPDELAARLRVQPGRRRLFAAILDVLAAGVPEPASTPEQVTARYPDLAAHVKLLRRCVDALPEILDGSRGATEVLFPGGSTDLVERVYRGHASADFYHRLMAEQVATAIDEMHRVHRRPIRLLEVGAGTGAGTAFVLAACAGRGIPVEFGYTDVSTAFLRRGEDTFGARYPFVDFRQMDIERDPVAQGFAAHGYDIVFATNVLHATRQVNDTLVNVRTLLRPGGLLLLNEVTRGSAFLTLTFGLTPGWWRYEDGHQRLPDAPLLAPAGWRRALTDAGFTEVRTLGFPGTEPDRLEQCVFVAQAPDRPSGPVEPDPPVGSAPSAGAVRSYVRGVFAEVLRFREADLDDGVTFENYGVDSLVSLDILSRFEQDLGALPATLLFEHLTITDLAAHLATDRREQLSSVLSPATPPPAASTLPPAGSAPPPAAPPRPAATPPEPAVGGPAAEVRDEDIAVVGVVGRYPGAADLDGFWRLLAEGRSGVTEIPADRWDWRAHFDPDKSRPQRTYSRWGGFIDGVDQFDPAFFGILPRDAENIDPQERLFLEAAWNLLEEAGCLGSSTREPETGVFVGTMYGSYGQLGAAGWAHGRLAGATSAYWSIANRVSYFLDLHGPSFAVDSACSSSLLAVHLAAESIRRGECRAAIAGGVNVILHPAHFVALCALNMLSADGRCKVFDAGADGFVPGEGVGAVLLKPLRRAVADGDRIWAVLKAGLANAGGKTGGYTVPNPNAQASLIAETWRRAGVDPGTIGYVEAHGTGTKLGDPIELAGLTRALGPAGPARVRCAVGSVKANVGHLEGAAGIAGLTKVLLQLRHGQLVPCANLDTVNPKIDLDPDRWYLPGALAPWRAARDDAGREMPRRAGVSSFGAGGANVHVVVEEYRQPPAAPPSGRAHLFVLSARTPDQLTAYADRVARFLTTRPTGELSFDELCYTSQVGRREMVERLAVRARDLAGLARRLAGYAAGELPDGCWSGTAAGGGTGPVAGGDPTAGDDLAAVAWRWTRGADVDWPGRWPRPLPRRVAFPTYPFQRKRYWLPAPDGPAGGSPVEPDDPAPAGPTAPGEPATPPVAEIDSSAVCRYQRPVWEPAAAGAAGWQPRTLLLVTDDPQLGAAFDRLLAGSGVRCLIALPGVRMAEAGRVFDPTDDGGYAVMVGALAERELLPDAVIHALADRPTGDLARDLDRGLHSFLRLAAAILAGGRQIPLRAVFTYHAAGDGSPQHTAVVGAIRTLALEHSGFAGASVEYAGSRPAAPERASHLLAELAAADTEVRYRDGRRTVRRLVDFTPAAPVRPVVRPHGVYLITGGTGALGLHVAEALAAEAPVRLVLASRSGPRPDAARRITALSRAGTSVAVERADVTRPRDVRRLLAEHGPVAGIIHAAGVTRDSHALRKTRVDVAKVLAPKVFGTVLLDEAAADLELDFFVLFSSVVGETGNLGQADYAAANRFLSAFAEQRELRRARGERHGRTVSIGWPLWADGGMVVDDATRRLFARRWSMAPMRTGVGLDVFRRALAGAEPSLVVVELDQIRPAATPPPARQEEPAPPVPAARAGSRPVPAEALRGPVPAEALRGPVRERLRRLAGGFLLVDADEVVLADDLLETGFDSVSLTELINEVNQAYHLDLLPTVLFECANLEAFADYLVRHHTAAVAAVTPDVAAAPAVTVMSQAASAPEPRPEPIERPAAGKAGEEPPGAGHDGVAVIGIAGTLPGGPGLDRFWQRLVSGEDLVGAAPADRLELHAHPDTAGVRGGFLDDVAGFDAELFRVSPAEAALIDPQQRLFLHAAWRAVEDAGYRPDRLAGSDTGLFVGVSTTDYADLLRAHGVPVRAHTASGIAHAILANRVSHLLDLHGPSEAVDTACSSSLVALHRAVRALAAGDCSLALVGGVNVLLSPGLFTAFGQSGMLSPDGKCRAFDRDASGYVRGEGVGAILLKPLAAAQADGDHVYAVVRGTAVNHGGRSPSLTAPNPEAQAQVLLRAYRAAGVDPRTVTAIEAHGTGTPLGDPVEVEGLKKAFATLYAEYGAPAPADPHIALGSVKTNIGHLEAAAGIAGILKVLLAMRAGVLPPTLHFRSLNPHVRLGGTPFYVNDRARPWHGVPGEDGRLVRRAGVSSFGFGGTNAHVVLEAPVPAPRSIASAGGAPPGAGLPGDVVLVLAARDGAGLRAYLADLAAYLAAYPDTDLAQVAYTLQVGRMPAAHRAAVVAGGRAAALTRLDAATRGQAGPGVHLGVAAPGAAPISVDQPLEVLAAGWVAGAEVPWERWWQGREPGRTSVPAAPLRSRAYWFDGRVLQPARTKEEAMPEAAHHPATRRGGKVTLAPVVRRAAPGPVPAREVTPAPGPEPDPGLAAEVAETAPVTGGSPDSRRLAETVRAHLGSILGVPAAQVASDRLFADLGLDSIFRMDLARRINADFGLELQAAELYEHDTVERLAAYLAAVVGTVSLPAVPSPVSDTPEHPLRRLVERVTGRPVDPARSFVDNGLTSFDMLRTVSALERRFGALRKTLLFDQPTVGDLSRHLADVFGAQRSTDLLAAALAEDPSAVTDPVQLGGDRVASGTGPTIVRKRHLDEHSEIAATLARIDQRYAKEGGLAGRDIAPLAFIGSTGQAYFNFSRRGTDVFAWSYAGAAEEFPVLAGEWLRYAARHGMRPNFLAMMPLGEVDGIPLTATPFGAVQRLENLAGFTLDGSRMARLRSQVRHFARAGTARTVEYRPGSDPRVDAEIADMIGRWGDHKQMINPYVTVVREELRRGVLAPRHRLFLTRLGDELANVVIVTDIPSEPGYLLDVEFYPEAMPRGGLEYAIVDILARLRDEGCTLFSFGASFGVKICESPTADPEVEQGLDELRSAGIFGTGNFQFKNKFRPTNQPIYLCQRADESRTTVADVILMIATPDPEAGAPDMLGADPAAGAPPAAGSGVPEALDAASPVVAPPTPDGVARRTRLLAECGYNPLVLRHAEVDMDFATDSWAELSSPAIVARMDELRSRARAGTPPDRAPVGAPPDRAPVGAPPDRAPVGAPPEQAGTGSPGGFPVPDWLPFDHAVPASSGRAAEALLCRAWPGPRGLVVHNGLFPTWLFALADAGFTPVPAGGAAGRRPRAGTPFQGDLDLAELGSRLAAANGGTAFVCVELSGNSGGGYPVSVANLRGVRAAARRHGVPLVLDATRIVENAVFVAAHEERFAGAGVWAVVRELLGLADAATFSLSKDFGVTGGGLVASRITALTDRLREHETLRGPEVGLDIRELLACALADRGGVEALVTGRMAEVRALWTGLHQAGVPVVGPAAGHCVLLDVARMPRFAGLAHPVESCLAWLYRGTGVRGAPHLGDLGPDGGSVPGRTGGRHIRLAVPVGLPAGTGARTAERVAALWRDPDPIPDLLPVGDPAASPVIHARYYPADDLPGDIEQAMRERYRPIDDNAAVLREHCAQVRRDLLEVPGGQVEVFTAGRGPVLALMHPFNIGAGVFAHQFAALTDRYRLVGVHHPGVGATTWDADLTLDGIAELYRMVLTRLDAPGPVHLLGTSFGGLVAQSFALHHPELTASLTLVGSSYKVGNRRGEVNRLSVVAREDFDRIEANGGRLTGGRAALEELLLRCESMEPQLGLRYLDVFATQPDLLAQLPRLDTPTLIVQGRHDTVIPLKTAHLLHGTIPDAAYEELTGAGHFPCLTHPDEVHALLVPFLMAHDGRAVAGAGRRTS